MENASLPSDVWNDVTTSPSLPGDPSNLVFKVIYIIIATIGVLDNLFILIIFIFFIKIADKVFQKYAQLPLKHRKRTKVIFLC